MENNFSFGLSACIAAIPALIAAIVSIVEVRNSHKTMKRMHDDDQLKLANEKRKADAKHKLEAFYYPYLLIAKENTSLYDVFRAEHSAQDKNFRTLPALLSNKQFSDNDRAILEQIIENDHQLKKLINENANMIDDNGLREALTRSATHYTIIELAFRKKITGEVDRFRPYVHPNDVYEKVEKKARALEEVLRDASE